MHTFSGRCDITPMVCCSFGGHSTPQFLQCSGVTTRKAFSNKNGHVETLPERQFRTIMSRAVMILSSVEFLDTDGAYA